MSSSLFPRTRESRRSEFAILRINLDSRCHGNDGLEQLARLQHSEGRRSRHT